MDDCKVTTDSADVRESPAARQYRLGYLNRRMARRIENLNQAFAELEGDEATCVLRCACGDPDCTKTVRARLSEYATVQKSPHRFIIAPGHAAAIDEVIASGDGYEIVEIAPPHRHENPLTDLA